MEEGTKISPKQTANGVTQDVCMTIAMCFGRIASIIVIGITKVFNISIKYS